ncbi:uncharacterized protein FA14DRAFT_53831 [Meira miltonrushii]|uniref:Arrestin C-terminal-like domain-containing protein n=1 Tax=Meira miltonrushii TaxID=1280837 RepID=A0A316VJT9_9BASI|nr:uncharacterized protein FA14DRAFT_53831 [Meira miltonrushii]PWN36291.1 hypothetical protein FA14DRAFT_53831 [Meira miltonrushii]
MTTSLMPTPAPPPYASNTNDASLIAHPQTDRHSSGTGMFSILPPCYTLAEEQIVPQTRPVPGQSNSSTVSRNISTMMRRDTSSSTGQSSDSQETKTSSSSGLSSLNGLFSKKNIELTMSLSDNLVFVYPNRPNATQAGMETTSPGDEATTESEKPPFIVVNLTLTIPENAAIPPNGIESLQVELMANESLGFPDAPFEYNTLSHIKKKVEEVHDIKLEQGQTYNFQTLLEIPHDVTPYDMSRYGRVLPRIRAKLKWSSCGAKSRFIFGSLRDLTAEQDVWIVSVPRTSNILDYARTHQTAIEDLGPFVIHVRTHHLTVGGYMRMGLSIPAPAANVQIEKVQLFLVQTTKLISRGKSRYTKECKPDKIPFMSIEKEELKRCIRQEEEGSQQEGSPLVGNWVARIPTDQRARPSTLQGSKDASLRVSHQLEVRIIFRKSTETKSPGQEVLPATIYSASWPLTLASCACKWRSLKLPMYSECEPLSDEVARAAAADWQDKHLRMGKKKHVDGFDPSLCSCGIPLDELLRYECEQDNAQQSSTIRLMREEIEAATLSPSVRSPDQSSTQDAFDEFNAESQQIAHHRQTCGYAHMEQEERTRLQLEQKARQEYR